MIATEDLFFGTVDRTTAHTREVVKCYLRHNAAAAILFHNHPSGDPEPSQGDINLTERLVWPGVRRILGVATLAGTTTGP